MRIISGSFRGKKIIAPGNLPIRPTTDFAKEGLFNVLNNHFYFDEITAMDLFSGIGSIGLELASRGCSRILSVDQDPGCVKFQSETIQKMNLSDRMTVLRADVFSFLGRNNQGSFDLIFADPPYDISEEDFFKLVDLIQANNWLNEGGELVVEHPREINFENHPHFLQLRKYGNVNFSFFDFDEVEP